MGLLTSFRGIMPLNTRERYIDNFFDNIEHRRFSQNTISGRELTIPSANIEEVEDTNQYGYRITLAAPGFDKSNFNVEVVDNQLTISGERQMEENTMSRFSRQEFNYGTFSRSFILPDSTEESNIEATYKNGVLHVFIPLQREDDTVTRSRKIEITSA